MYQSFANSTSLFIGDLDRTINDAELRNFFNAKLEGQKLHSCRVCRDYETKDSLGYGYLNFYNHSDAKNTLDKMNYLNIKANSNPYRLMWSHHDPKLRKNTTLNIFIRGIPEGFSTKELHQLAQENGREVFSVRVGEKGIGYVQFMKPEDAKNAISDLNEQEFFKITGTDANGQTITRFAKAEDVDNVVKGLNVDKDTVKKDSVKLNCEAFNVEKRNVFISALDPETTDEELKNFCEQKIGRTEKIHIIKDRQSGVAKGFAFVWFETKELADACVKNLDQTVFKGEKILVKIALTRNERRRHKLTLRYSSRHRTFYIRGVRDFTDVQLREIFAAYGEVISCRIKRFDDDRQPYAFCCYQRDEDALKMRSHIRELSDKYGLDINLFKTPEEREREYRDYRENRDAKEALGMGGGGGGGGDGRDRGVGAGGRGDYGRNSYNRRGNDQFQYSTGGGDPPPQFYQEQGQEYQGYQQRPGRGRGGGDRGGRAYYDNQFPHGEFGGGGGAGPYGGPPQGQNPNPNPIHGGQFPMHMQGGGFPPNYPSPTIPPHQIPPSNFPGPGGPGAPPPHLMVPGAMRQPPPQPQPGQPGGGLGGGPAGIGVGPQPTGPLPPNQGGGPPPPTGPVPGPGGPLVGGPGAIPQPNAQQLQQLQQQQQYQMDPNNLSLEYLQRLPPEDQKQHIGEFLYLQVIRVDQPNAGKITGMLLELPILDLFNLLHNQGDLGAKIREAQAVLAHSGGAPGQQQ